MHLKSVEIGGLKTPNNAFLAPLAGYTNAPFRKLCHTLGAGLEFTEMVSAKGLCYDSDNTRELLYLPHDYAQIKAVQLFGCEPQFMLRAAQSEDVAPFDLIDINMGCPVPKIFKNGEGSALLLNIPLAQEMIRAAKQSGKPVSVKFRIGLDENNIVARDFAVACEDAGADMLTVHGRTRAQMYSGQVNYEQIAQVKAAVKIPVIANGGVFSDGAATRLMDETGADGVMLARAAMYDPFIFAEITGTPVSDKKQLIKRQLDETYAYYGARFATVYMRKMIGFYCKGQPNASALRTRLMVCGSKDEIEEVFSRLEF